MKVAQEEIILNLVRTAGISVVTAGCGFGKSTLIPPLLCRAFPDRKVIVSQPRRLATVGVYQRVKDQNPDLRIGYRVRFEQAGDQQGQLLFVTEGLLLQMLRWEKERLQESILVLDEAHELSSELVLILHCVKRGTIPFRLVLLSATLRVSVLRRYLPGVKVLDVEGQGFSVKTVPCYFALLQGGSRFCGGEEGEFQGVKTITEEARKQKYLEGYLAAAAVAAVGAAQETQGNVLVFLPGARELGKVAELVSEAAPETQIIQLHSKLPGCDPWGTGAAQTIYLATNIAETSITLPNISAVVDSGLQRRLVYDPNLHTEQLVDEFIAPENATQRRGRTGRVCAGTYFQLYDPAWLQRRRLDIQIQDPWRVLLFLIETGTVSGADLIAAPPVASLAWAAGLFKQHNIVEAAGALTEKGKFAADFPFLENIFQVELLQLSASAIPVVALLHAFQGKELQFSELDFADVDSDFQTLLLIASKLSGRDPIREAAIYHLEYNGLKLYYKILACLQRQMEAWEQRAGPRRDGKLYAQDQLAGAFRLYDFPLTDAVKLAYAPRQADLKYGCYITRAGSLQVKPSNSSGVRAADSVFYANSFASLSQITIHVLQRAARQEPAQKSE